MAGEKQELNQNQEQEHIDNQNQPARFFANNSMTSSQSAKPLLAKALAQELGLFLAQPQPQLGYNPYDRGRFRKNTYWHKTWRNEDGQVIHIYSGPGRHIQVREEGSSPQEPITLIDVFGVREFPDLAAAEKCIEEIFGV